MVCELTPLCKLYTFTVNDFIIDCSVLPGRIQNTEDENRPPEPLTFLKNFAAGFSQGYRRDGAAANGDHPLMMSYGGSDVFGFIFGLAKAVVGGVLSLVINPITGLLGGFSQGFADLSAGASAASSSSSHA